MAAPRLERGDAKPEAADEVGEEDELQREKDELEDP